MIATREFYVGQTYYGSAPAPLEVVHNEIHSPVGQSFFCPICAEVWARAVIVGQPSMVRHRACERHRPGTQYGTSSLGAIAAGEIPGSLYLLESRQWNDSLPDGVIRREFRIHLAWAAAAPALPETVASMAQDMYNYLYQPRRSK